MTLLSILGIGGRAGRHMPTVLTGASVILSADHRNQDTGIVHAHTWKITAWVAPNRRGTFDNATYLQSWMETWRERHNGKCLPDKIAWGENIAADMADWLRQDIGREEFRPLFDVRSVLVERDKEGLSAAWFA